MIATCESNHCPHATAITTSVGQLLEAIDDLLYAQGSFDPVWTPLSLAQQYCQAFSLTAPTMTVKLLTDGLDGVTAAFVARAEWERGT